MSCSWLLVVVVTIGTDRGGEPPLPPSVACRGQGISPGTDRGGDHAREAAPTAPTVVSRDKVTRAVRGLVGPGLPANTSATLMEFGAMKVVVGVMFDISSGVNEIGASLAAAATITVPWAERNVKGADGPDDGGGGTRSLTDEGLTEISAGKIGSKRDTGGANAMAHRRGVTAGSVGAAFVFEFGVACDAIRNDVATMMPDKGGAGASTEAEEDDDE